LPGSAAVASVLGAALALWRKPIPFFMSLSLGFASGVLFATIALEIRQCFSRWQW
jgi:hypothetical protein